jgi:radical SAM/Cys-rich protein
MDQAPLSQTATEATGKEDSAVPQFRSTLSQHGLKLERSLTHTLQVNLGLLCNQKCRHCHLDAGPQRKEIMTAETADQVVAFAQRWHFGTIDITGGAPELNPNIKTLIQKLAPLTERLMIRSNLSVLNDGQRDDLKDLLQSLGVVVFASLPSLNRSQTESQRGKGLFDTSIEALKKLNDLGYGAEGTGLELNLVSNPTGAFLPSSQKQTEKRFRQVLSEKYGIVFSNLFNFANVPLGRFRTWLMQTGNYQRYMQQLFAKFNPCAVESVMCRTLVSVAWDGVIHDCDFNIAKGMHLLNRKIHVSELSGPPEKGEMIATAEHCYACTAGSGFT